LADSSVIPGRLAPLVEAGIMPAKMVPEWEIPARDLYMEYPQRLDAEAVAREFGLAEDEVPVMLLSVGAERPGNWAQKPRLPVADVLDLV
jgi:hypothetical protein